MDVVVSGGTGFVGSHLVPALRARGDVVTVLARGDVAPARKADAVVNLSGAGVLDERWSPARLKVIRDSRVETTHALVAAATSARVIVNASAVGYYGMRTDDAELDESSPPGEDVLARICVDWEAATKGARCRVAIARFGIVVGLGGGALARIVPMYRRFIGGPIGSGKQWWSWVHVDDVVSAILLALDTEAFAGPFNVTAERPARMDEVSSTLARVLHRPNALRVPAFALRAAIGPGAEALLTGQCVIPKKLLAAGFAFQHRDLESSLRLCVASR
jgi:uncharacterized protein